MSGPLQNKLQQYEATPPSSVWEKLSQRLDDEFAVADSPVSEKLMHSSIVPPPQVWDQIAVELGSDAVKETKQRTVIPTIYKRLAVAAIAIGLIALGLVYFTGNTKVQQPEIVNLTPQKSPSVPKRPTEPQIADVTPIAPTHERAAPTSNKKNTERITESFNATSDVTNESSQPSPEQAPLYELGTVSALQPVSVSAPPLRDKKGNLILDLATISNPNDAYITVTGPNGKQTKISSKFLSCLGYMNGNISASDLDSKGIRCTAQFDEWRRKLLSEPGFIPTANNFFDIFELKDLLQEM